MRSSTVTASLGNFRNMDRPCNPLIHESRPPRGFELPQSAPSLHGAQNLHVLHMATAHATHIERFAEVHRTSGRVPNRAVLSLFVSLGTGIISIDPSHRNGSIGKSVLCLQSSRMEDPASRWRLLISRHGRTFALDSSSARFCRVSAPRFLGSGKTALSDPGTNEHAATLVLTDPIVNTCRSSPLIETLPSSFAMALLQFASCPSCGCSRSSFTMHRVPPHQERARKMSRTEQDLRLSLKYINS